MIASQAAARQERNSRSGRIGNAKFIMSQSPETVARRLVDEKVPLPNSFQMAVGSGGSESGVADLANLIGAEGNRRLLLQGMARGGGLDAMSRGPFGGVGFMEAVNRGIATNAAVRRGVLPAAVVGGGLMGGAAVTEGAQQLMALMGFMQQGEQTRERAESSPIARA